jgi:hypothetical protein
MEPLYEFLPGCILSQIFNPQIDKTDKHKQSIIQVHSHSIPTMTKHKKEQGKAKGHGGNKKVS